MQEVVVVLRVVEEDVGVATTLSQGETVDSVLATSLMIPGRAATMEVAGVAHLAVVAEEGVAMVVGGRRKERQQRNSSINIDNKRQPVQFFCYKQESLFC